jgi:hypothetical protein
MGQSFSVTTGQSDSKSSAAIVQLKACSRFGSDGRVLK